MPMRTDPYARTPAKMSKTGKTFALVLALHLGLLWVAQAVWTSEPAKAVREVVAAQLIQEFRAPEPPKPEPKIVPPSPKAPAPQPTPVLAPQPPVLPSLSPSALPVITAPAPSPVAPTAVSPSVPVAATAPAPAVAPARPPVVVAAAARMDSCAKPRYPPASERLQEEGTVTLKFLISENGQVLSGAVEKSSGYKRLDDAALAALSLCKFRPATVDGKPKQEWSSLRYRWELNE
jgi:periplasmic protein TonB